VAIRAVLVGGRLVLTAVVDHPFVAVGADAFDLDRGEVRVMALQASLGVIGIWWDWRPRPTQVAQLVPSGGGGGRGVTALAGCSPDRHPPVPEVAGLLRRALRVVGPVAVVADDHF
jgi:hypothetical protein